MKNLILNILGLLVSTSSFATTSDLSGKNLSTYLKDKRVQAAIESAPGGKLEVLISANPDSPSALMGDAVTIFVKSKTDNKIVTCQFAAGLNFNGTISFVSESTCTDQ